MSHIHFQKKKHVLLAQVPIKWRTNHQPIIYQSSSINHIHLHLHIFIIRIPVFNSPSSTKRKKITELTHATICPATVQFQDLRHRQLTTWPRAGWYPTMVPYRWMVTLKRDDLGLPPFQETSIYYHIFLSIHIYMYVYTHIHELWSSISLSLTIAALWWVTKI